MAFKLKYQGKGANPIMSKIGYSKIDGKYQYKPSILKQDESVVSVEETPETSTTTYSDWKLTQDGKEEYRDITEEKLKQIKKNIKGFDAKRTDDEAYQLYLKNMGLKDNKENTIRYNREAQQYRDTMKREEIVTEVELAKSKEFRPIVVDIDGDKVVLKNQEEVDQYEQDYGARKTSTHKIYTDVRYDKETGETELRDEKGKIIEGIRDIFLPSYKQAALGIVERGGDDITETTKTSSDIDPVLLPPDDVAKTRGQLIRTPSWFGRLFGQPTTRVVQGTGEFGETGEKTRKKIENVEIQPITNPNLVGSQSRSIIVRDDQGNYIPNPNLSSQRTEKTLELLNKVKNNPINKKLPRAYQSIKNLKR